MAQQNQNWFESVKAMTEALVAIPSISPDAAGENHCGERIAALLEEGGGLVAERWPTTDGSGRFSVACLLRGEHPGNQGETIILMCHYDTVGVDEFQALDLEGTIAFEPERLRQRMLAELETKEAQGQLAARDRLALADLREMWVNPARGADAEEPAWMFGRGSVDMKSGVALHLAVMRQVWQERGRLAGNLLFLACPDEENSSAGILSAVGKLREWQEAKGLRYLGVINSDYTAPRSDDMAERYIYTGVVGKLLPSFYVLGDPTHVGEPFRGVDASEVAAELVRSLNLDPELSDCWPRGAAEPEEVAVPPITLKLRDLKSSYNVQTAAEAFVYVNWLTYSLAPDEAMRQMVGRARKALDTVLQDRVARYQRFKGQEPAPKAYEAIVLSFAELCERARQAHGQGEVPLAAWLDGLAAEAQALVERHSFAEEALQAGLANKGDDREVSRLMVAKLAQVAGLKGPAVVVFFSPPYYPHIQPQANELSGALVEVLKQLENQDPHPPPPSPVPGEGEPERERGTLLSRKFRAAVGSPAKPAIQLRGFYPYIADLSYVRLDESVGAQIQALVENMPLFGRGYSLDFEAMRALDCTVVNVGPWGKDAHGLYERVHMPYSFEVVPQLVYETVGRILGAG
jgi:arginine utilization protein RocB